MPETRAVKDIIAEAVGCLNDVESARAAKRVLLDLANAGFKILPREPSRDMTDAGWKQKDEIKNTVGDLVAKRVYRAMWDAASSGPDQKRTEPRRP